MSRATYVAYLLSIFFLLVPRLSWAQDDEPITRENYVSKNTYRIEMVDGDVFVGRIIYWQDSTLTVQVQEGTYTLDEAEVVSIVVVIRDYTNPFYQYYSPYPARTFFVPSAFMVPKGEGYYQNQEGIFNSLYYAPTDFLSVQAGFELVSTLAFALNQPNTYPIGYGAVKTGVLLNPQHGISLGVGLNNLSSELTLTPYFMYGYRNERLNASIGGVYIINNENISPSDFLVWGGIEVKLYDDLGVVGEFMTPPRNFSLGIAALGFRRAWSKSFWDLGLYLPVGYLFGVSRIGIPYLGYTRPIFGAEAHRDVLK